MQKDHTAKKGAKDHATLKRKTLRSMAELSSLHNALKYFTVLRQNLAGDESVCSGVYLAGVVSYAVPYLEGSTPQSVRAYKKQPWFDENIHQSLLIERNKLLAHRDQIRPQLLPQMIDFDLPTSEGKRLTGQHIVELHGLIPLNYYVLDGNFLDAALRHLTHLNQSVLARVKTELVTLMNDPAFTAEVRADSEILSSTAPPGGVDQFAVQLPVPNLDPHIPDCLQSKQIRLEQAKITVRRKKSVLGDVTIKML